MDIKFNCPKCGQHIAADEVAAGMTVACPNCRQAFIVPAHAPTKSPDPSLSKQSALRPAEKAAPRPKIWVFAVVFAIVAAFASLALLWPRTKPPPGPPSRAAAPSIAADSSSAKPAPRQDPEAKSERTREYATVTEIGANSTAKWTTNWEAFVAEFQPCFDKGEVTKSDNVQLAKKFNAHVVTWSGTADGPLSDGKVSITMPRAQLRLSERSTGYVQHLTLRPEGAHANAWAAVSPGQKVKFRTTLVGSALGPIIYGMGKNAGQLLILWRTKDAELISFASPSRAVGP